MVKMQSKPLSFARRKPTEAPEEPKHPVQEVQALKEEAPNVAENSPTTSAEKETMRPIEADKSSTGTIHLASSLTTEKDPMKAELIRKGYILISENEYGVMVRQAKGKPTFLARTKDGYKEGDKRNTLILPDNIDRAMKMRVAAGGMSVMQHLTQLVMRDLKENGISI